MTKGAIILHEGMPDEIWVFDDYGKCWTYTKGNHPRRSNKKIRYIRADLCLPQNKKALEAFQRVLDDHNHGISGNRTIEDYAKDEATVRKTLSGKEA